MSRNLFLFCTMAVLALCLTACSFENLPGAVQGQESLERIQAIETHVALALTSTPEPPPYLEVPPTVTLPPDLARMSVPKNLSLPCNRAEFVRDVTLPDGSFLPAGSQFTKTWELKNTGRCTWDSSYSLADAGDGKLMGVDGPVPILENSTVAPGEILTVSLELTAPQEAGSFRSYWKLMDGEGELFGIGEDGSRSFWLEIEVADRYDFANDICSAAWTSNNGFLSCPMQEDGKEGYAVLADPDELELAGEQPGLVLLLVPAEKTGGKLTGEYPAILVPKRAHYKTRLGCLEANETCQAEFELRYKLEDGYEAILGTWPVKQAGQPTAIDLDLSPFNLPGSQVEFILGITSQGAGGGDRVYLADPQIITPP